MRRCSHINRSGQQAQGIRPAHPPARTPALHALHMLNTLCARTSRTLHTHGLTSRTYFTHFLHALHALRALLRTFLHARASHVLNVHTLAWASHTFARMHMIHTSYFAQFTHFRHVCTYFTRLPCALHARTSLHAAMPCHATPRHTTPHHTTPHHSTPHRPKN